MSRPRLLDLFCCQGGAGHGYHLAGFDVVGVDLHYQKHYPFQMIEADALMLTTDFLREFDAIHASPPCQGYSAMRHAPGAVGAPLLINATRAMLKDAGQPYIIENVEEARWTMEDPFMLCGSMFGLGAQGHQLQRHRLFETSFPVVVPTCQHDERPVIGVYGGHARRRSSKHGGRGTKDVWEGGHVAAASEALGIYWMTLGGMSEAIPPAYTQFIGSQLMSLLNDKDKVL